jgi:hypothetical protein
VPASRSDARLLLTAVASVVFAGVVVAVVLLFATSGGTPKTYQPFSAGFARSVAKQLRDGGPFYVADPFGGNRNILFAIEDGKVVALSTILPDTKSCSVRWRGSVNKIEDCHGDRLVSNQLNRYETVVDQSGSSKGLLFVNLRKLLPAPAPLS